MNAQGTAVPWFRRDWLQLVLGLLLWVAAIAVTLVPSNPNLATRLAPVVTVGDLGDRPGPFSAACRCGDAAAAPSQLKQASRRQRPGAPTAPPTEPPDAPRTRASATDLITP